MPRYASKTMTARFAISDVAALIGEPSRAAILVALLDGRALPAGDLAAEARLSPAATSLHLGKLTQGGLLLVHKEGRHRYYRLANEDVAHALESLGVIATAPPPARSLDPEKAALRRARTCYEHLAGSIAVALAGKLERDGLLVAEGREYRVTREGREWFGRALRLDVEPLEQGRRVVARRCLDWTERRPHVAGALGAAILRELVARKWVARRPGSRALRVTERGEESLAKMCLAEPTILRVGA